MGHNMPKFIEDIYYYLSNIGIKKAKITALNYNLFIYVEDPNKIDINELKKIVITGVKIFIEKWEKI
jgi:hypothetical protein